MAASYVKSLGTATTVGNVGSTDLTLADTPAAGNLVVIVLAAQGGDTIQAVTDPLGNTWVVGVNSANGTVTSGCLAYTFQDVASLSASDVIHVDHTTSPGVAILCDEYTDVDEATAPEAFSGTDSGTAPSLSCATTLTSPILIAAFGGTANADMASSGSTTLREQLEVINGTVHRTIGLADRVESAAGTYTVDVAATTSKTWAIAALAFQGLSSGGSPQTITAASPIKEDVVPHPTVSATGSATIAAIREQGTSVKVPDSVAAGAAATQDIPAAAVTSGSVADPQVAATGSTTIDPEFFGSGSVITPSGVEPQGVTLSATLISSGGVALPVFEPTGSATIAADVLASGSVSTPTVQASGITVPATLVDDSSVAVPSVAATGGAIIAPESFGSGAIITPTQVGAGLPPTQDVSALLVSSGNVSDPTVEASGSAVIPAIREQGTSVKKPVSVVVGAPQPQTITAVLVDSGEVFPAAVSSGLTIFALTVEGSPAAPPDYVRDSFDDDVADQWGTTDTGDAWTMDWPTIPARVEDGRAITGIEGNANPGGTIFPPEVSVYNGGALARVAFPFDASVGAQTGAFPYLRQRGDGVQNVRIGLWIDTTGRVYLQGGFDLDAPTYEFLSDGTGDVVIAPTGTHSAGDSYWMRIEAEDDTYRIRAWKHGDAEPSTWQGSVTDTPGHLPLPGGYGIRSYSAAGMTGVTGGPAELWIEDFTGYPLPEWQPAVIPPAVGGTGLADPILAIREQGSSVKIPVTVQGGAPVIPAVLIDSGTVYAPTVGLGQVVPVPTLWGWGEGHIGDADADFVDRELETIRAAVGENGLVRSDFDTTDLLAGVPQNCLDLDALITSHGLIYLPVLHYKWAPGGEITGYRLPPRDGGAGEYAMQSWYEWVYDVVRACRKRVYEVWNEPNTNTGNANNHNSVDMAYADLQDILEAAVAAIRDASYDFGFTPHIIGPALGTVDIAYFEGWVDWAAANGRTNPLTLIDSQAVHIYAHEDPALPGSADFSKRRRWGSIAALRDSIDAKYDGVGTSPEIAITEWSYASDDTANMFNGGTTAFVIWENNASPAGPGEGNAEDYTARSIEQIELHPEWRVSYLIPFHPIDADPGTAPAESHHFASYGAFYDNPAGGIAAIPQQYWKGSGLAYSEKVLGLGSGWFGVQNIDAERVQVSSVKIPTIGFPSLRISAITVAPCYNGSAETSLPSGQQAVPLASGQRIEQLAPSVGEVELPT